MAILDAVRRWIALTAVASAVLCFPAASLAGQSSLYDGPGPRPGPDVLYGAAAHSPQLENAGIWRARPILVSGAHAYRDGEFLYQDFLYDDHGAASGQRDPSDPRPSGHAFSQPNGFYLYPSDPAYAENAADIVEFRVKPLARATAFRITLNTLKDPSLYGLTIAIGSSAEPVAYPHGANVSGPARLFLTVHGTDAELIEADTGRRRTPDPAVRVDKRRRQIEVVVPRHAWYPGPDTFRFAMGTGLWDRPNDRYLLPAPQRTATTPGGSGTLPAPPAFFNVAFRADEPVPEITDVPGTAQSPAWWRDKLQGEALARGDMTPFSATVDFAKLRRGDDDGSGVPRSGPLNRILVSRHEVAQGVDYAGGCLTVSGRCRGEYRGRLQPYAVYVPPGPRPARGWGMTLLLHSLSTNYNQYSGSRNQRQFADRGGGSIVITPEARGPDGGYESFAEADVFEVWADVARHHRLDPGFTVITGYSMGGIGTFKLAQQFPDLFARAQPTVGNESSLHRLASLRNVPVLMWNGAADELINPALYLPTARELDELGYRYELDVFTPGEHNSIAINDEYGPAAEFLGAARVDRDPFHVTYVVDPAIDDPKLRLVADHAYWLSRLRTREAGSPGTIDALSRAFGQADPAVSSTQQGSGLLAGGALLDPYPYTRTFRTWGATPAAPPADRLEIGVSNLAEATVDVRRARLSCAADVDVTTDGPVKVRLAGCGRTVAAG